MSATLTARPFSSPGESSAIDVRRGPVWWRCLQEFRPLLETADIDWWQPRSGAGVVPVKQNAQRGVWRVRVGGNELYVKTYWPNGWMSRLKLWLRGPTALQEWDVGHYAARYAVPSVLPVACGWLNAERRTGPSLLVTAAVPNALSLADAWLRVRDDPAAAQRLIDAVARLVARAHQCGFHHRDMHAANILVRQATGPEALFVDLHNVHIGRPVPTSTVVANLTQLNQWFRRHASRTRRLAFLTRYFHYRDQFATASEFARPLRADLRVFLADLDRHARRHAEQLWAKRDRRAGRDGRYFCRISPGSGWTGLALQRCKHPQPGSRLDGLTIERRAWQAALQEPLDWVRSPRVTVLKDSHTATVCRGELRTSGASGPQVPIIIKRPLPRSWLKRLEQILGRSRNARTWRMANKLSNRELPTAQPLAVIERRIAGIFRSDSLLLTEAIDAAGDLESYLTTRIAGLTPARQWIAKSMLIRALVRLIRDLRERGFSHRDFKATNILVTTSHDAGAADRPRLVLIDLDGVRHHSRGASEEQMWRAVARLNVSLLNCAAVTRSDRLRVLKSLMLAPGRTDRAYKTRWHDLDRRTQRKQQDKASRRRWKLEHYGRE